MCLLLHVKIPSCSTGTLLTMWVCIPTPSNANFRASWLHFGALFLVKHNLKNTEGKTYYSSKIRLSLSQKVYSHLLQSAKIVVGNSQVSYLQLNFI